MDEGIAQAVEDWETRPFSGGYRGLQDLADASFSGAVEAAGTWCPFINGRAVGIYDEYEGADGVEQEPADIEQFEGASGIIHEAPHESLPLLFAMRIRGGDLVARHPTSDRSLEEMHRELSDEEFTGYLELSEHVLSGDYYVVYQQGRSMSTAFIGNARRLKTGDEAFERATTEVGVYEVRAVPVRVVDIPDPTDGAVGGATTAAAGGATAGADATDASEPEPGAETADEPAVELLDSATDATPPVEEAEDEVSESAVESMGVGAAVDDAVEEAEPVEPAESVSDSLESGASEQGASEPEIASTEPETPEPEAEPSPDAASGATAAAAEVDRLVERVESLTTEQKRLTETVRELESRLDRLLSDGDGGVLEPSERLTPEDALAETTLLVRYDSESGATLADVVAGTGSEEALADNLQVEPRTTFPADETAVAGQPYASFVADALAPRFVEWLVADLPLEIRRANATTALGPLYEALPSVDRATFGTNAALEGHGFDVTLRDRDGDPLVVARTETDPGPPDEEVYESLVRAAHEVREAHPSLVGAFLITKGYVDGAELDPIREATRDRVLSRSRRKSYVNHSGGGFHLCVVEAGDESFHLELPGL